MELNITKFFNEACPMDYSASVSEIGQNAGQATWQAACEDSSDFMILDDEEKREAFRKYVKGFGAWSEAEIAAWTDIELNALLLQFIAGDIRQFEDLAGSNWETWDKLCEDGNGSSNLYGGSMSVDGQVYYSIGD